MSLPLFKPNFNFEVKIKFCNVKNTTHKPTMDYFKQVPMKYSHKTRLGNWSEEWELEQTK